MSNKAKKKTNEVGENEQSRMLKKAVETIHMSGKLTLTQKKVFNNLIKYAFNDLSTSEVHRIGSKQLIDDIEFDSKNMAALRGTLNAIMSTKVALDLLNDKGVGDGFNDMNLLSEVKLLNGIITYSFPPTLRKLLDDPKVFAMVNLTLENLFKSVYSMNLYEQIIRFRNVRSTGFIELGTWRKLIGAEEPTYQLFKLFNYMVLKPAIKEINEKGEFLITPEFRKIGRSVSAIRFAIEEKTEPKVHAVETEVELPEIGQRIMSLGITRKVAVEILADHHIDYIEGNLNVVIGKIKAGKVKDPNKYAVWLKRSLEQDWRPGVVTIDNEISLEKKAIAERERLAKEVAEKNVVMSSNAVTQRLADARAHFELLSLKKQKEIESRFIEFAEKNNSAVYKSCVKNGLHGTRLVSKAFESWFADQIDNS